jgi:hypothetical protein
MRRVLASFRTRARLLARIGCVSIGTVYVLVGALALLALSGRLIEAADEERVVQLLMSVNGGPVVIWAIVLGAAAYVVWRVIEAVSTRIVTARDGKVSRGALDWPQARSGTR